MIQVLRPVYEVNKPLPRAEGKSLDNNTDDSNRQKVLSNTYEYEGKQYEYTEEDLNNAVTETNKMIFGNDNHFEFRIHKRTGTLMVKLIDNDTEEVLKELPPEKILDLVANIWELVGIVVDERG